MKVQEILSEIRSEIVAEWFRSTMEEYSGKTATVYMNSGKPFANPVGATFAKAMETIVDYLAGKTDSREEAESKLEEMVRIRALQDFSPSKGLDFIFRLKAILLKRLEGKWSGESIKEMLKIETEIDRFVQFSFDIYAQCREKLFELRNREIKNQARILLKRANIEYSFDEKSSFSPCG